MLVSSPTWGICNRALFSIIQSAWSKQLDSCSLALLRAVDADHFKNCISQKLFGSWHLNFERIFDWMPLEEASTGSEITFLGRHQLATDLFFSRQMRKCGRPAVKFWPPVQNFYSHWRPGKRNFRPWSTFQFMWCSIWKPGDYNFWVKIGFALERSKMSFPHLSPSYNV